jgi:hypothetical protein
MPKNIILIIMLSLTLTGCDLNCDPETGKQLKPADNGTSSPSE